MSAEPLPAALPSPLSVTDRDGVRIFTLDRPAARNAVDFALAEALSGALLDFDADPGARIGILTGAGGTFCAGMDLKAFANGEPLPTIAGRGFAGLTEAPPTKVLIAAVEGHALAGGFELALACDLIVAAETARFGLPEVKRGLAARGGGLLRLPRRMPFHLAMEYLLTGDMLDAARAQAFGLVNQLTPAGGALEAALALAARIAANGPLAVAASKRVVVESADWSTAEMFERQRDLLAPVFASADAREGARAFSEKRPARWTGT